MFTLLFRALKGFMKAFIKPFGAPQRSVKIKVEVNFFSSSRIRPGRVNISKKECLNIEYRFMGV